MSNCNCDVCKIGRLNFSQPLKEHTHNFIEQSPCEDSTDYSICDLCGIEYTIIDENTCYVYWDEKAIYEEEFYSTTCGEFLLKRILI